MTTMHDVQDQQQASSISSPSIVETVTVRPQPSQASGFLTKPSSAWDWKDLRDYVIHEIEARRGPQPRNFQKEYGIFNRFVGTFQELSGLVARYAFEVCDGFWKGAPISVERFCKGSDDWFAWPILAMVEDSGWEPRTPHW